MALNRIERWTRQVLEQEARKRGIRDPEVRSHTELARLILRHDYVSPHGLRSARKLVGALLESASATLRASLIDDEQRQSAADMRPAARAPAAADPEREAKPASAPPFARRPSANIPDSATGSSPAVDRASSGAPAAVHSSDPALATRREREPDATGPDHAREREVGAASPDRAREPEPTTGPQAAVGAQERKDPAAASVRLDQARPAPRELHVRWNISDQAAERARMLLGERGELAVRLVSVRADPTHVVLSDVTEHGPIEPRGEWIAELASDDTHCVTSVGVRSGTRFVSIVHRSSRPSAAASS